MKIIVDIISPVSFTFKWKGRIVKIPTKVVVESDELERFEKYLTSFSIKYKILTNFTTQEDNTNSDNDNVDNNTEDINNDVNNIEDSNSKDQFSFKLEDLENLSRTEIAEIAKSLNIKVGNKSKKALIKEITGLTNNDTT